VNIQRSCFLSVYADGQVQARRAGFEEGVASAEESQQIYDELVKIDRGLAKIGEILKESKEFWEGVDRKLSPTPASQQMKDPPDGITTGSEVCLAAASHGFNRMLNNDSSVSGTASWTASRKYSHRASDRQ
jgi:hypothetical protein